MPSSLHTLRYQNFCQLLKDARNKAGLTQSDVAKTLGKPQSYVAKYEQAERRLDVIEFIEIANAIECDLEDLMKQI